MHADGGTPTTTPAGEDPPVSTTPDGTETPVVVDPTAPVTPGATETPGVEDPATTTPPPGTETPVVTDPAVPTPPDGTETPDPTVTTPDVEPAGVGVSVVDTVPEPEDFSFTVVSDSCKAVLEALEIINAEFATLVRDVIPAVTPEDTYAVFNDPEASITILVPPRPSANGLVYAYEQGNVTAKQVCCLSQVQGLVHCPLMCQCV